MIYIKTAVKRVKTGNRDTVSMVVQWAIHCVIFSFVGFKEVVPGGRTRAELSGCIQMYQVGLNCQLVSRCNCAQAGLICQVVSRCICAQSGLICQVVFRCICAQVGLICQVGSRCICAQAGLVCQVVSKCVCAPAGLICQGLCNVLM